MDTWQDHIPPALLAITDRLEEAGFEAYAVGGCIRDLLLGRKPKDWDITTNATPDQIQQLFENTFYTNEFGTVGVVTETEPDESLKVVEITPYRTEGEYSDGRRPDSVTWAHTIDEDLRRRDFTINTLAYRPKTRELLDHFSGTKDLRDGLIRAVGKAEERFAEDALRMLRAVRIAAELGFTIEKDTAEALTSSASLLAKISKERIRDEWVRILNSAKPMEFMLFLHETGLLAFILPELEEGIGIEQNQAHKYSVFEHNVRALQHAADKKWPFEVRLSALLHDIGKPRTRRWSEEKNDWTFHGHDVVGAKMAKKILSDLHFSREITDTVQKLVRWHMFFSDPEKITLSGVRRLVRNVGPENIENLMKLRMCDRIGTGRPKEQPFRLRKYQSMIEQALRDPISVTMLNVDGKGIMDISRESPGPRIGWILHALLEEVLDDPAKNTADYLQGRVLQLATLSDKELKDLGEEGKERKTEQEEENLKEIRKKYFVD